MVINKCNYTTLGWLIIPNTKTVYIYRPQAEVECLENPSILSDEGVLPGFILDLSKIWGL